VQRSFNQESFDGLRMEEIHWVIIPGSLTLLQQNPPVLNWQCQLTQVDLYNGRTLVVVLDVVVMVVIV